MTGAGEKGSDLKGEALEYEILVDSRFIFPVYQWEHFQCSYGK